MYLPLHKYTDSSQRLLSPGDVGAIVLLDLLQVTDELLEGVAVDHQTRHSVGVVGDDVGCTDVLSADGEGVRGEGERK